MFDIVFHSINSFAAVGDDCPQLGRLPVVTIVDTECVTQCTHTQLSSVKVTDSKVGQIDSKMAGDCL